MSQYLKKLFKSVSVRKINLKILDTKKSDIYCCDFNGREKVGIEKLKNPKAFTDYSQTIDDVFENLEDYNLTKN